MSPSRVLGSEVRMATGSTARLVPIGVRRSRRGPARQREDDAGTQGGPLHVEYRMPQQSPGAVIFRGNPKPVVIHVTRAASTTSEQPRG